MGQVTLLIEVNLCISSAWKASDSLLIRSFAPMRFSNVRSVSGVRPTVLLKLSSSNQASVATGHSIILCKILSLGAAQFRQPGEVASPKHRHHKEF